VSAVLILFESKNKQKIPPRNNPGVGRARPTPVCIAGNPWPLPATSPSTGRWHEKCLRIGGRLYRKTLQITTLSFKNATHEINI
ncbi:MAG: hypothetical protein RSD99_02440, partial [Janthinobacterium sp.]